MNTELTNLFLKIASKNWAGVTDPYDGFDDGELDQMKSLCALGLIKFIGDETCTWIVFTEKGKAFGEEHKVSTHTKKTFKH